MTIERPIGPWLYMYVHPTFTFTLLEVCVRENIVPDGIFSMTGFVFRICQLVLVAVPLPYISW